ncbi:MAG: AAA family ATPase [Anaerolineae bacterium]
MTVFIGPNAAGKSNLFDAFLELPSATPGVRAPQTPTARC